MPKQNEIRRLPPLFKAILSAVRYHCLINRGYVRMALCQRIYKLLESLRLRSYLAPANGFNLPHQKCALTQDADPDIGVVRFPADCITYAKSTIAERMSHLLSLVVKIVFAIDGTYTRCSVSRSLKIILNRAVHQMTLR